MLGKWSELIVGEKTMPMKRGSFKSHVKNKWRAGKIWFLLVLVAPLAMWTTFLLGMMGSFYFIPLPNFRYEDHGANGVLGQNLADLHQIAAWLTLGLFVALVIWPPHQNKIISKGISIICLFFSLDLFRVGNMMGELEDPQILLNTYVRHVVLESFVLQLMVVVLMVWEFLPPKEPIES